MKQRNRPSTCEPLDDPYKLREKRTFVQRSYQEIGPDKDLEEANELAMAAGIPVKRVSNLYEVFQRAAKGDTVLDKIAFGKTLEELGELAKDSPITKRIYGICADQTLLGISWSAFFKFATCFMTGDRTNIAKLLFTIVDETGDGNLNKLEIIKFISGGEKEQWRKRAINELLSEMIFLVDEDGTGMLSRDQFVSKASTDDDVWEIFEAISPLSKLMKRLKCPQRDPIGEDLLEDT